MCTWTSWVQTEAKGASWSGWVQKSRLSWHPWGWALESSKNNNKKKLIWYDYSNLLLKIAFMASSSVWCYSKSSSSSQPVWSGKIWGHGGKWKIGEGGEGVLLFAKLLSQLLFSAYMDTTSISNFMCSETKKWSEHRKRNSKNKALSRSLLKTDGLSWLRCGHNKTSKIFLDQTDNYFFYNSGWVLMAALLQIPHCCLQIWLDLQGSHDMITLFLYANFYAKYKLWTILQKIDPSSARLLTFNKR